MFDFVNKKKRVVQAIMLLAVLPFLFWGVESYQRDDGNSYIAIVDGEEIQRREFEQALRDQQDRMRSMLGDNYDSAIFDNPEFRTSVLEQLIQQRLLRREAVNTGMTVLDSQLAVVIADVPQFQEDGMFSNQQYQALLRDQGINPVIFEARMREELMLEQLLDAYNENGFVSETVAKRVLYLSEVQREINQMHISPDQFLSQIKIEDAAIQDYYDSHQIDFRLPERVRVEYLVLSLASLAAQQDVGSDEVRQYYDDHQSEFGTQEERQASHILFTLSASASEQDRAEVLSKADAVLAQVRQNPEKFSELAAQHSEDPGSATQDGDLGYFSRGMMVKSFEDEIFQMQPDEISELVETDFGFHIIKLVAIKAAEVAAFDDVKNQIESDLKTLKAGNIFGETAEDFSNTVYEQSDSLEMAAQEFGLTIQTSDWIDRQSKAPAMLANDRMLDAIFTDDVLMDARNTSAIEIITDTLVSARVIEHRTASTRSLAIVKDEIVGLLKAQRAAEMVASQGEEKLDRLLAGDESAVAAEEWEEAKQISYLEPQGIDGVIMQTIFRVDLAQSPAYTGMVNPQGGYTLTRVNGAIEPDMSVDEQKTESMSKQLQQMFAQEEMGAYLAALRQRYDVSVRQQMLMPD